MAGLWSADGRSGRRARGVGRRGWLLSLAVGLAAALIPAATEAGQRPPPSVTERQDAEKARLDKIHAEIDDLRGRLAGIEERAGSILDGIEELDLRVALLAREAEVLRQEARGALEREREARQRAEELGRRIEASEDDLRGLLREAYKAGPTRYVRVVAASASPAQFAAGRRAIEALGLGEARRIEAYRVDRGKLDAVLAELDRQKAERARLESELRSKARELRDGRERKEAVLAGLRREEASQKKALLELTDLEKQVRSLIDRLSRPGAEGAVPSLGFARFKGLLAWPTQGRLAIPFGNVRHPRFSTIVPHPGLDIAAAPGREVHAVFDGLVVFSSWFKGYGDMVVIDHGDGYLSVYGHVSERLVTVGQDVRQGDLIARSGEGGSFDVPGLYFEIRHDGKPENPAVWLRRGPGRPMERSSGSRRGARQARGAP